jgi:hypothetical protein
LLIDWRSRCRSRSPLPRESFLRIVITRSPCDRGICFSLRITTVWTPHPTGSPMSRILRLLEWLFVVPLAKGWESTMLAVAFILASSF